jgi:hypothetical protein
MENVIVHMGSLSWPSPPDSGQPTAPGRCSTWLVHTLGVHVVWQRARRLTNEPTTTRLTAKASTRIKLHAATLEPRRE